MKKIISSIILALIFVSCSGSDKSSVESTQITKFEGLFLSELVEDHFNHVVVDCPKRYVYFESGSETAYIVLDNTVVMNKGIQIQTVFKNGKIKLILNYASGYLLGMNRSGRLLVEDETSTFIGQYKINDSTGIGQIYLDGVNIASFTYGGSYNDLMVLSVGFNSNLISFLPLSNHGWSNAELAQRIMKSPALIKSSKGVMTSSHEGCRIAEDLN